MRDEVEAWLADNKFNVGLMATKWNFPAMAIIEASETIYNKVYVEGEVIKPIKVGWRIRSIAQAIANRQDIQETKDLKSAHQLIKELREELEVQRRIDKSNSKTLKEAYEKKAAGLEERIKDLERSSVSKVWAKMRGKS